MDVSRIRLPLGIPFWFIVVVLLSPVSSDRIPVPEGYIESRDTTVKDVSFESLSFDAFFKGSPMELQITNGKKDIHILLKDDYINVLATRQINEEQRLPKPFSGWMSFTLSITKSIKLETLKDRISRDVTAVIENSDLLAVDPGLMTTVKIKGVNLTQIRRKGIDNNTGTTTGTAHATTESVKAVSTTQIPTNLTENNKVLWVLVFALLIAVVIMGIVVSAALFVIMKRRKNVNRGDDINMTSLEPNMSPPDPHPSSLTRERQLPVNNCSGHSSCTADCFMCKRDIAYSRDTQPGSQFPLDAMPNVHRLRDVPDFHGGSSPEDVLEYHHKDNGEHIYEEIGPYQFNELQEQPFLVSGCDNDSRHIDVQATIGGNGNPNHAHVSCSDKVCKVPMSATEKLQDESTYVDMTQNLLKCV